MNFKLQPGDYVQTALLTEPELRMFLSALQGAGAKVLSLDPRSPMYCTEGRYNHTVGWGALSNLAMGVDRQRHGTFIRDVTDGVRFPQPPHFRPGPVAYPCTPTPPGDPIRASQRLARRFGLFVVSLIGIFVALALLASAARAGEWHVSAADNIVNTDTGGTFELGYRTASGWDVQAGVVTASDTYSGRRGSRGIFTVTKRVALGPGWFGRFGLAGTPDYKLIGPVNFRFGAGVRLGRWEIEYMHASSAGIFDPNWGLDSVGVRYVF